jgi:hypothetical protein
VVLITRPWSGPTPDNLANRDPTSSLSSERSSPSETAVEFTVVDDLGNFEVGEKVDILFQGHRYGTLTVSRDSPRDSQTFTASRAGTYDYELSAVIYFYDSNQNLQQVAVSGQGRIGISDGDTFHILLAQEGSGFRVTLRAS